MVLTYDPLEHFANACTISTFAPHSQQIRGLQRVNDDEIVRKLKEINVAHFIRAADPKLGFGELDRQIRDAIIWAKKYSSSGAYKNQLPSPRREAANNAITDLINNIESFNNIRETDPTGFINSRDSYVQSLQAMLARILTDVVEPYRSYLIYSRAKDFVDDIETNKDKAGQATSARQEAATDEAASQNAQEFDELAKVFGKKKRWWIGGLVTYILLTTLGVTLLYTESDTLRNALKEFNPSNIPAYILKIMLLGIFFIGLNFILKNYNSCLSVEITAMTRAARLKTWRAFINAPELDSDIVDIQKAKAEIAREIASLMFKDIPLGLDKGKTKIFEAPVNITSKNL